MCRLIVLLFLCRFLPLSCFVPRSVFSIRSLGQVVDAYTRMLKAKKGEIDAVVTTAEPLTPQQEKALVAGLKAQVTAVVCLDYVFVGGGWSGGVGGGGDGCRRCLCHLCCYCFSALPSQFPPALLVPLVCVSGVRCCLCLFLFLVVTSNFYLFLVSCS